MTQSVAQIDRTALAAQTFGRIYRLALLVTSDQNAAADLTVQTFAALPQDSSDPERALARGLLTSSSRPAARRRARWQPDSVTLDRAGIGSEAATKLLTACWNANPEARLVLGLHTLWGLSP